MLKLDKILQDRLLTQKDLYDMIKESNHTTLGKDRISRLVNGQQYNLTVKNILAFCEVLNVTPNDLIEYESVVKEL